MSSSSSSSLSTRPPADWFPSSSVAVSSQQQQQQHQSQMAGGALHVSAAGFRVLPGTSRAFRERANQGARDLRLSRAQKAMALFLAGDDETVTAVHAHVARVIGRRLAVC